MRLRPGHAATTAVLVSLISGCVVSGPPYVPPAEGPAARVTAHTSSTSRSSTFLRVWRDGACKQDEEQWVRAEPRPDREPVFGRSPHSYEFAVSAGKRYFFHLYQGRGEGLTHYACSQIFSFVPRRDAHYEIEALQRAAWICDFDVKRNGQRIEETNSDAFAVGPKPENGRKTGWCTTLDL